MFKASHDKQAAAMEQGVQVSVSLAVSAGQSCIPYNQDTALTWSSSMHSVIDLTNSSGSLCCYAPGPLASISAGPQLMSPLVCRTSMLRETQAPMALAMGTVCLPPGARD